MSEQGTLSVKNFERYQHYKDRTPPWIKLYNDVLDDYEFGRLQDASKAHLILIWLLASRTNNEIPNDAEWISRKIGATDKVDLRGLVRAGFLIENQLLPDMEHDASKALDLARSREGEGEGETEGEALRSNDLNGASAAKEKYLSPKDRCWRQGPAILQVLGIAEKQARSCIGRWLKKSKPEAVLAAIEGAQTAGTLDPIPYITEALKENKPVEQLESGRWRIRKGSSEWDAWRQFRRRNNDEGALFSMDYGEQIEVDTRWPMAV